MKKKITEIYGKCAKLIENNLGKAIFNVFINENHFSVACWSKNSVPGEKLRLYDNFQFSEWRTEEELEDIYNELAKHVNVILL